MSNDFQTDLNWGSKQELAVVVLLIFISGLIAKIPFLINIEPELFYPRNIGTIVFPTLISYLSWRYKLSLYSWGKFILISLVPIIFMNLIPGGDNSDTFFLSSIHSLFLLLSIYGLVYVGEFWLNNNKRIEFLQYCGDLLIMSGLLLISGGLFTTVTIGLFEVVGFNIEDFYFENVAVWGIPAIPILASYLIFNNTNLVSKISPAIAKIFTPLVFIILLIFSFATIFSEKNIFADRELLLLFNIIIIAVLALILFYLSQINSKNKSQFILLLSLSLISIIDNLIVIYAISSRLFEFGITPNRLAVAGLNILVFFHLIIISRQLFLAIKKEIKINNILSSIGGFLPMYVLWTFIIVFLFPIIFNFK